MGNIESMGEVADYLFGVTPTVECIIYILSYYLTYKHR